MKVSHDLPSPAVLRNSVKMKVLVKNNLNSSGTVLQDTVVWKSCNEHINKNTRPSGIRNDTGILVYTHAQKQLSTDNFNLYSG